MMSDSIEMSFSDIVENQPEVKRRRGRPPKPKVIIPKVHRPRGRPPKPKPVVVLEPVTKYDKYVGMYLSFRFKSKHFIRQLHKDTYYYYIDEVGKGIHKLTDAEIDDAIEHSFIF